MNEFIQNEIMTIITIVGGIAIGIIFPLTAMHLKSRFAHVHEKIDSNSKRIDKVDARDEKLFDKLEGIIQSINKLITRIEVIEHDIKLKNAKT